MILAIQRMAFGGRVDRGASSSMSSSSLKIREASGLLPNRLLKKCCDGVSAVLSRQDWRGTEWLR